MATISTVKVQVTSSFTVTVEVEEKNAGLARAFLVQSMRLQEERAADNIRDEIIENKWTADNIKGYVIE